MAQKLLENAGGCLIRVGGILGGVAVGGVLSLFALFGYLYAGLPLSWLIGLSLLSCGVCLMFSLLFPAYFAILLAVAIVAWWFEDIVIDDSIFWVWIFSGLLGLLGLILLLLALFTGQAYQLAAAVALITQYMFCMAIVVRQSQGSEADNAKPNDKPL